MDKPASYAHVPTPVVPNASTPAGGSRRFVLEDIVVTNSLTSGDYSSGNNTARWRTSIPSNRLHHKVTWGYRPNAAEIEVPAQSGSGAWLTSMREWSRTSKGLYIPGVQVFQTMALPSSWEAVTMSQEWRFDMVVPLTHGEDESGTGMVLAGKVYVVAEWEPVAAAGDMSDDELRLLFSACRLNVDQAISSFSTPE